ncbi:MAG: hypothetical protein LBV50_01095, partial [Novosphingobium sp.]|jgi:hypothetical protein|nr:hypothetical protein [Novosphingobium sp.]
VALRLDNAGRRYERADEMGINTEGEPARAEEMRVLLSAEAVPVSVLANVSLQPVRDMARAGRLHGLLLTFDPTDPTKAEAAVLAPPEGDYGEIRAELSLTHGDGILRRLEVAGGRVTGELQPDETPGGYFNLTARFSAPVSTDRVTQELTGAAARDSEPVRVLIAFAEALARGDMATATSLTSADLRQSVAKMAKFPKKIRAQQVPELVTAIRETPRVVVREISAEVEVGAPGYWIRLLREDDGSWKAANW